VSRDEARVTFSAPQQIKQLRVRGSRRFSTEAGNASPDYVRPVLDHLAERTWSEPQVYDLLRLQRAHARKERLRGTVGGQELHAPTDDPGRIGFVSSENSVEHELDGPHSQVAQVASWESRRQACRSE
jgi:hypothetical protein